uniref:Uncharacterized protein n=1 Tax=Candidatus Kentrum sp. TUN TaxID=2126343 RepID=A0A450ZCD0_9GAMM|nr:MAG: hypothetical protein BECKTUN1418D_GA0071000_10088 [Candidatus Kentron sp. TUN]
MRFACVSRFLPPGVGTGELPTPHLDQLFLSAAGMFLHSPRLFLPSLRGSVPLRSANVLLHRRFGRSQLSKISDQSVLKNQHSSGANPHRFAGKAIPRRVPATEYGTTSIHKRDNHHDQIFTGRGRNTGPRQRKAGEGESGNKNSVGATRQSPVRWAPGPRGQKPGNNSRAGRIMGRFVFRDQCPNRRN